MVAHYRLKVHSFVHWLSIWLVQVGKVITAWSPLWPPSAPHTHLLYMSRSGFQMYFGGILMSTISPYSDLFHFIFTSCHSCQRRQWILYTVHCTVHCELYIAGCTLYSLHWTLNTVQWALCTIVILNTVHFTLFTVKCNVFSLHCILYNLHCIVYSLHCTLFGVNCTL